MNHPGRRKTMGIDSSPSTCSMIVCCVSRFGSPACAPIVDRYTILSGRALSIADFRVAAVARASGKLGAGSKFGGTSTKTPSAPSNADASAATSRMSAVANRSEEHTSELQSRLHLVCRLLLEKKKKIY